MSHASPALGAPADAKNADPRAWPSAYEPVSMTAKELLDAAAKAEGSLAEGEHTVRVAYTFRDGGLDGTAKELWRGHDYRFDSTTGPIVTAEGRYHGQLWETTENGYTLLKRGVHKRTEANARALENPDEGDDVRMLGRLRAPTDVYVLSVSPPNGRPERRFYDAATFLLVRRETTVLGRLIVSTYDDYHTDRGVATAYRTASSDGRVENDIVWRVTRIDVDVPVDDAELAIPGSRRIPVRMPDERSTVRLPARIDEDGHVIVRLTINGRGLDFQLDSGADGIVIDRDVARQLGLKAMGRWSETVAGTYSSSEVIVPMVQIGKVVMTDTVMSALPFSFEDDTSTKVVGLLGFDFIAGCVLKIDYANGTVDAIPVDAFQPPVNATVLDTVLDDRVPMVSVLANGALGNHFILDTGADDVLFFTPFAQAHPDAVDDHSPGKYVSRMFNSVFADGVGGKVHMRAVVIEHMQLATVRYNDLVAFVITGHQQAFEGEDEDGLLGVSVLRAFDVYLDYANARVVLVPNKYTKPITSAKKP